MGEKSDLLARAIADARERGRQVERLTDTVATQARTIEWLIVRLRQLTAENEKRCSILLEQDEHCRELKAELKRLQDVLANAAPF